MYLGILRLQSEIGGLSVNRTDARLIGGRISALIAMCCKSYTFINRVSVTCGPFSTDTPILIVGYTLRTFHFQQCLSLGCMESETLTKPGPTSQIGKSVTCQTRRSPSAIDQSILSTTREDGEIQAMIFTVQQLVVSSGWLLDGADICRFFMAA